MFVKREVKVRDWATWHADTLSAVAAFMADHQSIPNLIVTNPATSERVRVAMEGDASPASALYELAWAAAAAIDAITFCVRDDLPDDVMAIVYDSEASFD